MAIEERPRTDKHEPQHIETWSESYSDDSRIAAGFNQLQPRFRIAPISKHSWPSNKHELDRGESPRFFAGRSLRETLHRYLKDSCSSRPPGAVVSGTGPHEGDCLYGKILTAHGFFKRLLKNASTYRNEVEPVLVPKQ